MNNIKAAVILAAGMGTRLRSITNGEIPKGFLSVNGRTLVERSISKLRECGIEKIYIVTGHLNEFYEKLAAENEGIVTVRNENFANTGSMASLAVLENIINEDFLLLESDLIYEKRALLEAIKFGYNSCMMISGKTNSGDEYYIEVKDNNLHKGSKNKAVLKDVYGELVGVNKISMELFNVMLREFKNTEIKQYHYEDAMIDAAKSIIVGYKKVEDLVWAEIDDESHLERVERIIIPKLKAINEE